MLPLKPPIAPAEPVYPTRDRLLRDPGLRRQALAVLAAAALAGCGGEAAPGPMSGREALPTPPAGGTATPTPLGGSQPAPVPAPQPLAGDVATPITPQAQPLRGEATTPEQPAPVQIPHARPLGGIRAPTAPPPPAKP